MKIPAAMAGTAPGHDIAPSVNPPPEAVGTLAGHATVPAGVSVCVCVANAEPVKVSAGIVMEVVPDASVVPLNVLIEYPAVPVAEYPPVAIVADAVPFVPAGVPALVALVVWLDVPANVGTLPGQAIVGWVNDPAAIVGTAPGQAIAPSENPPPEFVPAGVPALTALVD